MLKRWLLYVGSVALGLAVVGALLGAFVLALLLLWWREQGNRRFVWRRSRTTLPAAT